jgi:DtxR family Mn-dependent transcriptional regulator
VTDQTPEHLRYLAALGLVPGAAVIIRARAPFDGPLTVGVGAANHPLDSRIARALLVEHAASTSIEF